MKKLSLLLLVFAFVFSLTASVLAAPSPSKEPVGKGDITTSSDNSAKIVINGLN